MVDEDQVKLKLLNRQLHQVNEDKINNAQALSRHDQFEQDIHEIDLQERNIFNRLFETWEKDRDFIMQIEHIRIEQGQNRKRLQSDLENKKHALNSEKRKLHDAEDQLHHFKDTLRQEGS